MTTANVYLSTYMFSTLYIEDNLLRILSIGTIGLKVGKLHQQNDQVHCPRSHGKEG